MITGRSECPATPGAGPASLDPVAVPDTAPDDRPAEPPLAPPLPLVTDRLTLRPITDDDLDDVLAYQSLPEVHRYLYTRPRTREEMPDVIATMAARTAIGGGSTVIHLGLVPHDGPGRVVGDVLLIETSREHRQGEVGYVVAPSAQGRGYAVEACRPLLAFAFGPLRWHRVQGRLDARNAGSARVLERLGMRREAHLVENERVKGEWTDEVVYGLLAREWREQQERRG